MTQVPYKTAKGTNLTARVFTANAPETSILAGKYSMTWWINSSAPGELATAMEEAAAGLARGVLRNTMQAA